MATFANLRISSVFWLKKILSQFFMPIPLTLVTLLLACFYIRRRPGVARALMVFAITWLLLLSSSIGSSTLLAGLERQYPLYTAAPARSCVVMVLGSGHDDQVGGLARHMLSATALERLSEGVAQLKAANSKDCLLAVSGWNGGLEQQSHARRMAEAAIELGAEPSRILMLESARDTIEEAQALRQTFGAGTDDKGIDALGGRQLILVTSASHMPRAMRIFRSTGLEPQAAPTGFLLRREHWWRLSTSNLDDSQKALHEYLGLAWLTVTGR